VRCFGRLDSERPERNQLFDAIAGAWDPLIVALKQQGMYPTAPIVERPEYEDDDATPDSSATKA
jgi:hypothetical protein